MRKHSSSYRSWALALLLGVLAVSLFFVAYPLYVIRPFRTQGQDELAVALVISRFRGIVALVLAVPAVIAAVVYFRAQSSRTRKAFAIFGGVLACALAIMARVNVFERMFHPIAHASYFAAAETKLDDGEKVLAVKLGNDARAYPVRNLSYHHLVNDEVDRKAIVATY